jgi:urease alpha subunit
MHPTYDLILKNGVVANQDGVAVRDIGISKGRIVALGQLGMPMPDRWLIARACISCPA